MFLYVIRHKASKKEYVGITTTSLPTRWSQHKSVARRHVGKQLIHQAIRDEGVEAFEMELLGQAETLEELWAMEERAVRERKTMSPDGYNRAGGRPRHKPTRWSEETRRKMAEVNRKKWTPEFREKLRQAHLGHKRSAEARRKTSESLKDYYRTHKAKPQTERQRRRNSASKKKWWSSLSKEQRLAMNKTVTENLRRAV